MSNDQPQDPSLGTLLELSHQLSREGIMTMLPGKIVDYDDGSQRASVQPLIQSHVDNEDDTVSTISTPIIHDVPVMFLGPARGRITFPVGAGDTCALWFSCRSLARWRNNGGEVDPGDDRTHDLTDAICIVGLHDFAHVPTDAPTDAVVIHSNMTKVGSSSSSHPPALADELQTALNTMLTALNVYLNAIQSVVDPTNMLTPVIVAAVNAMKAAVYAATKMVTE